MTDLYNYIQMQKLGLDNNKNIVRSMRQKPEISYNQMHLLAGYSFCYTCPLDPMYGGISTEDDELDPQYHSTVSQVMTQIELDSVYLSSILSSTEREKNQCNQSYY